MKKSSFTVRFQVFNEKAELKKADAELLEAAKKALETAWAPYSKFHVGAAIRMSNRKVVTGTNIENASFPMCLCAEPSALAAAKSIWPNEKVETMAISVKNYSQSISAEGADRDNQRVIVSKPCSPCGACRQILAEAEARYGQKIRLLLQGETGEIWLFESASDLLPLGFSADFL